MYAPNKPLTPIDSFWWQMQHPTFLAYINYMFTFRGPVDYDDLLAVLENRLLAYPRFRQRVVTSWQTVNHPAWETIPDLNLQHYVHRIAVPEPHDRTALIGLLNQLSNRKFDPRMAPWEMFLIEGMESGTMLLGRMHHCIADGIALMNLLNVVADEDPAHSSLPMEPPLEVDGDAGAGRLKFGALPTDLQHLAGNATRALWKGVRHPIATAKTVNTGIGMGYALTRVVLRRPDSGRRRKEGLGHHKVLDWTGPFDLEEIHMVEEAAGVTVNDMLMTVIAGGLRRYWIGRDWPVDRSPVRAIMPFNVRPADEANALGNGFGVIMPNLFMHIAEPLDRLIMMHDHLSWFKQSSEAAAALATMRAVGMAPLSTAYLFNSFMRTKVTVVITNLAGPTSTRYLAGHAIDDIVFWVPAGLWLPVGISIFSYQGEIRVGVVSDENLIPDPQQMVADIEAEWTEMRAAFGVADTRRLEPAYE